MQTVALIADGQIDSLDALRPSILRHQRIVAVDGGLVYCKKLGIRPSLIVGDFDSCTPELLAEYGDVPKIVLKKEKDETDLEAAIDEEIRRDARKITLFGAFGRRIDHSLANLLFLSRYPGRVWLETEKETIFAIDKKASLNCAIGQTLSLIPITGPAVGITTQGLKWELNNKKMDLHFFGISNICLKPQVEIAVQDGILLCFLNH